MNTVDDHGISQPVGRHEDLRFITGRGQFTDNINVPGQVHAHFVRSQCAHGILRAVNVAQAHKMPGVLGVFIGSDLCQAGIGPIEYMAAPGPHIGTPISTPRHALAINRVRYVGEQLAVVVAESEAQAIDAADHVEAEIESLPPVVDVQEATSSGAPAIWPTAPDNVLLTWRTGDASQVEDAFARAAHVTRLHLKNNRVIANPIESRASIATYDAANDRYDMIVSSQGVLYFLRGLTEQTLRIAPDRIHLRTYDVGGAFGTKELPYPEDIALLYCARALGRPIKWNGTRSEQMLSDNHARDAIIDCALALDTAGNFQALRATIINGIGAYCSYIAAAMPIRNTTNGLPLLYKTPLIEACHKIVVTNSTPIGPYRGAGREQAALVMERLVDQAARELNIDRIELRRRNVIPSSTLPYRTPVGRVYDSGDFEALLDKALTVADWKGFVAREKLSRSVGKVRGQGISFFIESVGGVPFEGCHIWFGVDGTLSVVLATQSQGQGHETSFAQVVAHQLGIRFESVHICEGDSSIVPRGMGSFASRSMIMAGSAIKRTCDVIVEKGRRAAAHILEASEADIEFSHGAFRAAGTDYEIGLLELAARIRNSKDLPESVPNTLDSAAEFTVNDFHFPNGCHICEVEIDPDTGETCVASYVVVADFGVIINPTIVRGQVHGGVAQGLGQALFECCIYDREGQLLTGSFMDYPMPRALDFPEPVLTFHSTPSTQNPLGVKGCGEAGVTGSIPAINNAIADALARVGANSPVQMPFTPEKIWRVLRARTNATKA